jgi:hypothetical protein
MPVVLVMALWFTPSIVLYVELARFPLLVSGIDVLFTKP